MSEENNNNNQKSKSKEEEKAKQEKIKARMHKVNERLEKLVEDGIVEPVYATVTTTDGQKIDVRLAVIEKWMMENIENDKQ